MNSKLKAVLKKPIYLKPYENFYEKDTEVIFDANILSYKAIIDALAIKNKDKSVTFKILPKNSKFAIGSDNAIEQGEIIIID